MASTSINQHDYPMTNHGLLLRELFTVLCQRRGSISSRSFNDLVLAIWHRYRSLSLAYKQIYKPGSGPGLVVNCSWMLDLPGSDLHFSAPEEDPEHDFEVAIRRFIEEDEEAHTLMIRTICDNLFLVGGQVVAAAGNDKKHARARRAKSLQRWTEGAIPQNIEDWIDYLIGSVRGGIPDARYPAAFASVIGVGALPKGKRRKLPAQKYESSEYSNLGDKPAGEAIMTLEGEEGRDSDNKNKGILGLYVGDQFPEVEEEEMTGAPHRRKIKMVSYPNEDCWAWWAGTSFAAPIVTGAIAALGARSARTQEAVAELKKCVIEQGTVAQGGYHVCRTRALTHTSRSEVHFWSLATSQGLLLRHCLKFYLIAVYRSELTDLHQKGAAMNTQMKTDTWIYYLTIVLGLTVTAGVLGTITLLLFSQSIPEILLALGMVAGRPGQSFDLTTQS